MQSVSLEDKQRTNVAVGSRIRQARLAKGLSQKELADELKVDSKYLSRIENGHSGVSAELLMSAGRILGKGMDYFYMDISGAAEAHEIDEDIAVKLERCSREQKLLISRLIDAVLNEQQKI